MFDQGILKEPGGKRDVVKAFLGLVVYYNDVERKEKRSKKVLAFMAEEQKILGSKQLKARFVHESDIPTLFVNTINVRAGLEEFFLTLGTALPLEIKNDEELKLIDTVEAEPFFRCAVTRSVMRQMIDLMETVYNQQTQQIESLRQLQEQEDRD
jgi:hypothetical protein